MTIFNERRLTNQVFTEGISVMQEAIMSILSTPRRMKGKRTNTGHAGKVSCEIEVLIPLYLITSERSERCSY